MKLPPRFKKYAPQYYDMEGNEISMEEWSRTCDPSYNRHIGLDKINGYVVSTVWLGLDHGHRMIAEYFDKGDSNYLPVIFETMIFHEEEDKTTNEQLDMYQERYSTKEEALEGHLRACDLVRKTII